LVSRVVAQVFGDHGLAALYRPSRDAVPWLDTIGANFPDHCVQRARLDFSDRSRPQFVTQARIGIGNPDGQENTERSLDVGAALAAISRHYKNASAFE